ncbi:MAG: SDR family oxidoreductase [Rhodospirillaceae bacterium]|nr:MAG: SDR family oxidoreductase [Rhodospirillaceae bacterium]
MIPIDLEGRVILVCGVARGGIGGATARLIAAAGATVFAVDKAQELLDPTIADIEAAGGRCFGLVADLTESAQTDPIIATVVQRFGRLDGVANVAGGTRAEEWMKLEETPTSSFRATLNLNLEYVFRICRDAAAFMIKNKTGGSLVNVGSISALTSAPYHAPYGAAKSGISALTRTMANEWMHHGIRANTVSPGAVATERVMSRATNPADGGAAAAPAVKFTSVDALGHTIVFLLSDLASGISGQNIVVDSGISSAYCLGSVGLGTLAKNP